MKRFNVAAAGMFAVLSLCFLSCEKKEKKQVFHLYNWSYYTPDSVLQKFEKEYNCIVKCDYFDSNETMYSKIKAGARGYDLTIPSQDYTSIMIEQKMVQKIDLSKFPNSKYINPEALKKAEAYDPDMTWCVPYCMGASGIMVNKKKISGYPRDYTIFEKKEYAGHMTMMDDMREAIGSALRHSGCSLNSRNEDEIKAASLILKEKWTPNLIKFDAEGFGKSFAAGDFWVCQGYAEIVFSEVPEEMQDEMIDFFIPESGAPAYFDSMVILKDAPNYDLAMKFIDFSHRPEIYAEFLDGMRFPPFINLEAAKYTKKKPMYPTEDLFNCELKMDVGETLDVYNSCWQDIRFAIE